MTQEKFIVVGSNLNNMSDVPKDSDIFYRCTKCGDMIPSLPDDNIGCNCGNVYIDHDSWRLFVIDFGNFEVVKRDTSISL
jgi:hypothetical protein